MFILDNYSTPFKNQIIKNNIFIYIQSNSTYHSLIHYMNFEVFKYLCLNRANKKKSDKINNFNKTSSEFITNLI